MRIRWFGQPWPSAELRAPICDDDAYRIDPPVGKLCLYCKEPVEEDDRGVAMAFYPTKREARFSFEVNDRGLAVMACAYHVDCMGVSTLGPELAHLYPSRKATG